MTGTYNATLRHGEAPSRYSNNACGGMVATTLITAARTLLTSVRPLRLHLTLLVLAAVVPMLAFAVGPAPARADSW
jgi:hypothetical protein